MDDHNHNNSNQDASVEGYNKTEKRLWLAILFNGVLTLLELLGGLLSSSLALVADALHNFSDAASLLLALMATRIARRPPDEHRTFGYRRAESVAALVNLTILSVIGFYLFVEGLERFYYPATVQSWAVIAISLVALIVDLATAFITRSEAKRSLNVKAAFIHNLSDALASMGVLVSGVLILFYDLYWTDGVVTLLIASYVVWQCLVEMPKVINLLMEGRPKGIGLNDVKETISRVSGVNSVHHIHVWQIDEKTNALEAHVVVDDTNDMEQTKNAIKQRIREQFNISHSTLEFEQERSKTDDQVTQSENEQPSHS